jgi:PKD repeat protein
MRKIMKSFFLLFLCLSVSFAQKPVKFVTYGRSGNPDDGDDNKIQAINFSVPAEYQGNISLRIFDADASANNDDDFGIFDSRFQFSFYKGEYKEEDFYSNNLSGSMLKSFSTSNEPEYDDSWITFFSVKKESIDTEYYTLFVEGLEGNDANIFQVFLSSSPEQNSDIIGSSIYSYQPSIRLIPTKRKNTIRFLPGGNIDRLIFHTFDFDKTKFSVSTFLRDDVPLPENNSGEWSKATFSLTEFEKERWCGFNYGPLSFDYNDVNFKITDMYGNSIPVQMNWEEKAYNSLPSINFQTNYIDCHNVEIDLSSSKDNDGDLINFTSLAGESKVTDKSKFNLNFPIAGVYQIKVLAEDNSNAVTRGKVELFSVVINALPIAKAGNDIIVGEKDNVYFDAGNSVDYDGRIINYNWNFGDGYSSNQKRASHIYSSSGTYLVVLTVTDNFNSSCNSSADSLVVTVNSKPIINTTKKIIGAEGEDLFFDASGSYDPDGEIILYEWDFGKLGKTEGQKIIRHFSNSGRYNVLLKIKDNSSASNSIATETVEVIINSQPIADAGENKFVAVDESFFVDARKSFDKDGRIISYHWDFGDGNETTGISASHSYPKPGAYKIKLSVVDDSETRNNYDIDSIIVFVNHPPIAKIETDNYLSGREAYFDASSSYDPDGEILSYEWNFGDNTIGSGKTVNHYYQTAGTYSVTLTVRDNSMKVNNSSFTTEKIIINKPPIADAGKDHLIAVNQTVNFDASSSIDPDGEIAETNWYINDELASTASSFGYTFLYPGLYKIRLQVKDNFPEPLTDTDYAIVKVNSSPVAKISGNKIIAPNEKINLNAFNSFDEDGVITSYKWITEEGNLYLGKELSISFENPRIYRVILQIVDDANVANSVNEDTVFIKVNSSPVIIADELPETCNNVITIDANSTYDPDGDNLYFTWELPDNNKILGDRIFRYNFSERGTIPVILSVNDLNNVANSITKKTFTLNINNPPVANAGNDTTICVGDVVLFSALKSYDIDNNNLDYRWIFDDGTEDHGSTVIKKYKAAGIYKAVLEVRDNSNLNCGISKDEKIIIVNGGPVANAGKSMTVCANNSIQFDGSKSSDIDGIVNTFEWDFGDGEKGSGEKPNHIYTKAGVYKVVLTVFGDISGDCDNTDKDEITVTVNEAPLPEFAFQSIVAENQTVTFDASGSTSISGNIIKYIWDFGDGSSASGIISKHSFSSYGKYKVRLTVITDNEGSCNESSIEKSVVVNKKPQSTINAKSEAALNEVITFDASSSNDIDGKITKYIWDFGDGFSSEGIQVNHFYSAPGSYQIKLNVYDNTLAENNFDVAVTSVKINSSPVAAFEIPTQVYVNSEIILDASSSYDKDGMIEKYEWYVNDQLISNDKIFNYSPSKPGYYSIKLSVYDNSNQLNNIGDLVLPLYVVSD